MAGSKIVPLLFCFIVDATLAQIYTNASAGLTDIPGNIPLRTTELYLSGNNLGTASFPTLNGILVEILDLSQNEFKLFPDLEGIGSTLRELYLKMNSISYIPPNLLDGLTVLTDLNLESNDFTVFPDLSPVGDTLLMLNMNSNDLRNITASDVQPLVVLETLYAQLNRMIVTEDLSPLGDTLLTLVLLQSGGSACPSLENAITHFSKLESLVIPGRSLVLFPNLSTSCSQTQFISARNNEILYINSTFIDKCVAIKHFQLENNLLTALPNISSMGQTLEVLTIQKNKIFEVDQDFMRAQTALQKFDMSMNEVNAFPDLSRASNTLQYLNVAANYISDVDSAISTLFIALVEVDLAHNLLTSFPDFSGSSTTVRKLCVDSNQITSVSANVLNSLIKLDTLILSNNRLSSFPDVCMANISTINLVGNMITSMPNIRHLNKLTHLYMDHTSIVATSPRTMAQLGKLQVLGLSSLNISELPTICPEGALTLNLENNDNINLCNPKMAWLKQNFFTVKYVDIMCNGLGKMWSKATVPELLSVQSTPQPGNVRRKYMYISCILKLQVLPQLITKTCFGV